MAATTDIITFANAAARDSAIAHPKRGQAVLLLDTGEMLIYYGNQAGWRPPWNVPWGEVARVELASFAQFVNVNNLEANLGTMTFVPVVNRRYAFRWRVTVETGDKGQSASGSVGMALVTTFGTIIPTSIGGLIGGAANAVLDGVIFPATTIPTFYPLPWRRFAEVQREITSLVSAGTTVQVTAQYAYGSVVPGSYIFTTTTDGLYGKNDAGSETSLCILDIGPSSGPPTS